MTQQWFSFNVFPHSSSGIYYPLTDLHFKSFLVLKKSLLRYKQNQYTQQKSLWDLLYKMTIRQDLNSELDKGYDYNIDKGHDSFFKIRFFFEIKGKV